MKLFEVTKRSMLIPDKFIILHVLANHENDILIAQAVENNGMFSSGYTYTVKHIDNTEKLVEIMQSEALSLYNQYKPIENKFKRLIDEIKDIIPDFTIEELIKKKDDN